MADTTNNFNTGDIITLSTGVKGQPGYKEETYRILPAGILPEGENIAPSTIGQYILAGWHVETIRRNDNTSVETRKSYEKIIKDAESIQKIYKNTGKHVAVGDIITLRGRETSQLAKELERSPGETITMLIVSDDDESPTKNTISMMTKGDSEFARTTTLATLAWSTTEDWDIV